MKATRSSRFTLKLIGLLLCALSLGTLSFGVLADFTVKSPNQSSEPYGNAENTAFYRAMHGAGLLSEQEQQQILDCLPEKETGRYYGRIDIGFAKLQLQSVRNRSPIGMGFGVGSLNQNSAGKEEVSLELALGYIFDENFRIEAELLTNRITQFSASPVFSNLPPPRSLTANIKNTSVIGNIYYDFTAFDRVKPYLMASIGIANNRVVSDLVGGGSDINAVKRTLEFAYGAGAGVRFGIFTRWFIDLKIRALLLSNALKIQPTKNLLLQGKYSLTSISIGAIYLF